MQLSSIFLSLTRFFLPPTIISLLYLYLYPALGGCQFPIVQQGEAACHFSGSKQSALPRQIAPFRLLVLADPQLEGDTSLPKRTNHLWEDVARDGYTAILPGLKLAVTEDLPRALQSYRKRLDLLGNDYYLAHIYRSVKWWTEPTHAVVLGDLLGSQWIDDSEFERRASRFWHTVFAGAELVPREITATSAKVDTLGVEDWSNRIIAVAGNHDIGYAGDIDSHRVARFEDKFGHVNWETRFKLEDPKAAQVPALFKKLAPELRLVVLNTMNIDEPARDHQLRDETLMFLGRSFNEANDRNNPRESAVVLTHIPLHKDAGICVDSPLFNLFSEDRGGGIREQNHLRPETSQRILHGFGSKTIILNGHDHEGCDTYHYLNDTNWDFKQYGGRPDITGVREITVRSMMGSYGGNAGLLSAWFDEGLEEWKFEYSTCPLGVQHIWWAVHILAVIEILLATASVVTLVVDVYYEMQTQKEKRD